MSRTCHTWEDGSCVSWQDDEKCCVPGSQTHNCEMGRLLEYDKAEFDRRREADLKPEPPEPGPFTEIPAAERTWLAYRVMRLNARDEADESRLARHWWRMLGEDGSYMLRKICLIGRCEDLTAPRITGQAQPKSVSPAAYLFS